VIGAYDGFIDKFPIGAIMNRSLKRSQRAWSPRQR
jgi:hypothetical protein